VDPAFYNPFAPGSTFTAIPPPLPQPTNPSPQANQYLQELDYSGDVPSWSSGRSESIPVHQQSVVVGNHEQPSLYNPVIGGQHWQGATVSPTNSYGYPQEQTNQATYSASNFSSLEEQTKNLGLQEARYQTTQVPSTGNLSASGSISSNQQSPLTAKKANPSQNANPADRLFEDLVDLQALSANFKKAGMSGSLTRPNKNNSSGI
jgi:hypothetical protein